MSREKWLEAVRRVNDARARAAKAHGPADAPAPAPEAAERAYEQALAKYAAAVEKRVLQGGSLEGMRLDLLEIADKYEPSARAMARKVSAQARNEAARMLGTPVQVNAATAEKPFIEAFGKLQAGLLRNNVERLMTHMSEAVALGKEPQSVLWIAKNGAATIARTETMRLQNEIIQYWAVEQGSETYTWKTAADERVRHGHSMLHNTVQRWDSPPNKNDGFGAGHPATSPNCRCQAVAIPRAKLEG